jgi:hypothetical protein
MNVPALSLSLSRPGRRANIGKLVVLLAFFLSAVVASIDVVRELEFKATPTLSDLAPLIVAPLLATPAAHLLHR